MIQKEENDWQIKIVIGLVVAVIAGAYIWFKTNLRYSFSKKAHKSKLARAYQVRNETLNKWIDLLGTSHIKEQYKNSRAKKVVVRYYTESFGKPSDRPKYKGSYIVSKEDIWKATDYGDSTVYKKIVALENPEEIIGMSHEAYNSLEKFPPKHVNLILNFINQTDKSPKPIEAQLLNSEETRRTLI